MQIGNGASTVAWEPDATTGFDDEVLGWYRAYTRLHLRLFPYEWTLAARIAVDGRPIVRPLGLAYPEAGVHPSDEYMFGDDLLVAPVLERGARSRSVVFPPGRWVDFFDGHAASGPGTTEVDAPLGALPLFVREGAIIPMLRPSIDAIAPTAEPDRVDSFATTPGDLWARVVPGPASSFTVFDGTVLAQAEGDPIELSIAPGDVFRLGAVFEVAAFGGAPSAVSADGVPLAKGDPGAITGSIGAYAVADDGTVSVHVGPGAHTILLAR
jgi:alpha-D-xyloside xylohydrolase